MTQDTATVTTMLRERIEEELERLRRELLFGKRIGRARKESIGNQILVLIGILCGMRTIEAATAVCKRCPAPLERLEAERIANGFFVALLRSNVRTL